MWVLRAVLVSIVFLNSFSFHAFGLAASRVRNGKIIFDRGQESTYDSNTFDIYVMDPDGGDQIRLTDNSSAERGSVWSPNGKQIAFASNRAGSFDIWTMQADGSNPINRTDTPNIDEITPDWSPDGAQIAFAAGPQGDMAQGNFSNFDIYVMAASGKSGEPIKRLTNSPAEDSGPAWSPDGKQILFESFRDGNYEVYVMKANGTKQTNLTNNLAVDGFTFPGQTWSPDGKKIAFPSSRGGQDDLDVDIWVMNADGSNPVNLTQAPGTFDGSPVWSPNGQLIAFVSFRPPLYGGEVYVMDATDGSNQTNLTNTPDPGIDETPTDWRRKVGDD